MKLKEMQKRRLDKVMKVQAMVERGAPPLKACKKVGLAASAYYTDRKKLGNIPFSKAVSPKKRGPTKNASPAGGKVALFVGKPADLVEVFERI